jgi:CrcB protein
MPSLFSVLVVAVGAAIGGVSRYMIATMFNKTFPFGTLGINISGCFVIGIVAALCHKHNWPMDVRLFLTVGFCGGYTTFSAFSLETITLMEQGHAVEAFSYVALSVVLSLAAAFGGLWLGRTI